MSEKTKRDRDLPVSTSAAPYRRRAISSVDAAYADSSMSVRARVEMERKDQTNSLVAGISERKTVCKQFCSSSP